jgi:ribonuclease G
MTRKRTRESLAHLLCEPCPTCGGRGEVKTARTVCYEILRELLREARQFNAREFRVLAAPNVIDLFLDEESQSLAMLSDFIGKPISLHAEGSYTQEQYDIVLMSADVRALPRDPPGVLADTRTATVSFAVDLPPHLPQRRPS